MSQPPPYNRITNFTGYAIAHPSAPYNPSEHDAELNSIETTVDALCTNIALIQRDDGRLRNESVGIDQLNNQVRAIIAIGEDAKVEPWTTGHVYNPGDAVSVGVDAYLCVIAHVAGTFGVDLGAGKWVLIGLTSIAAVSQAALVSYVPNGTIASSNVQAAITEVALEAAAATSNTIPLAQKGAPNGVATLDPTGKVPVGQIGDLSATYITYPIVAALYVPLTQRGAALGVATLDGAAKVPVGQLPDLSGAYVPLAQRAAANGVATLDAGTKVPVAQVPDLSAAYIAIVQKGVANGVATLDAGTKVPAAQLPDLSGTYIAVSQRAVPLGVATLDATGMVEPSQLPASGGPFIPLGQKGVANGVASLDAATQVPTVQGGMPTGAVISFAGTVAPTGWLLCAGQSITTAAFPALFAAIGYAFGGAGANFNVPDLRGRVAAGKDDMGGAAANRLTAGLSGIAGTTLGAAGGAETHVLTTAQLAAHNHGVTDPQHNHTLNNPTHVHASASGASFLDNSVAGIGWLRSTADGPGVSNQTNTAAATASVTANVASTGITTQNNGSGTGHQNTQPTLVLNSIIKT